MAKEKSFEELVEEEFKNRPEPEEDEEIEDVVDEPEEEEIDEDEEIEEEEPEGRVYSKDQVEKITKARVKNYSKRMKEMSKYKDAMDTLSDITGLDPDKLADTLLNMTPEQQAKMLNIPVEQVQGAVNNRRAARLTKKQQDEAKRKLKYLELSEQDGYEDLPILKDDVEALLDTRPGLTYEEAYVLVRADTEFTKPKPTPTKKKRRVVSDNNVSGTRTDSSRKVSPAIRRAAKEAGMDVKEYVAYSKMSNIDDYYKYNNIKAKG